MTQRTSANSWKAIAEITLNKELLFKRKIAILFEVMREIHENIDYSEETQEKHRNACPHCGQETGIGHAWMTGVPLGAHYAVYDSGTWAWPANRIGFADAIAFAAENGQDVWFMHDTCGKQHAPRPAWNFLEYFPTATASHRCFDGKQAKVTLGEVLPNECYDIDEIVIHWSKRPTPPPPSRPYNGPRGPRKRSRK